MAFQIQLRRGTASAWSTVNPILVEGEVGLESDTNKMKVGNGSTAWNSLSYATATPTQLNLKADLASPTFTGNVVLPSTTSIGTVSATEIGYVDGVTSAIQTQLDSKLTATTAVTSNRNAIINGAMNVWQRGTSTSLALGGGGYVGPDRWWYYNNGFTSTISRQSCGSTLPQFQYCARIQRTSGQTGTAAMVLFSPQETINSLRFAGKNATVSFYARISSGASRATTMDMSIATGTGTDQSNFGGGAYTGASQIAYINPTLTTSWQRFSSTAAVASNVTEIGLQLGFIPTGTAGASDYFEITGIQLEEGSVATPFEFEDAQVTLAKCQRYYCAYPLVSTDMSVSSGNLMMTTIYYPATMRATPTITQTGSIIFNANAASTFSTDPALFTPQSTTVFVSATATARCYLHRPVQLSAEL